MTSRDFCFWLQGFLELREADLGERGRAGLTLAQTESIQRHLALVFKHEIDPSMGGPKLQAALDHIHNPSGLPGGPTMRC